MTGSPIDRRTFLVDVGRGAFAVALVTVAGCSPTTLASLAASPNPSPTPGGTTGPTPSARPADGSQPPLASPPPGGVAWTRINLGFVSAYILVRGGEAALVDTGVAESSDRIEASLTDLGLGWANVGHVILTHHHGDHQGSTRTVVRRAPEAAVYAGAEDVSSMLVDGVKPVADGEKIFDLQIVTTPGHTAGSISVFDPIAGVVVAGDALRTENGAPALPGSQFTEDMDEARRSIVKLGGLAFETLLVGHGEPITAGASAAVAALGAAG